MDITLLLGIGIGFFLIIIGIGFGQLRNFWDLSSIIITVGGTFAALLASFKLSTILEIPKHFKIILQKNKNNPAKYIEILYELSQEGRKNAAVLLKYFLVLLNNYSIAKTDMKVKNTVKTLGGDSQRQKRCGRIVRRPGRPNCGLLDHH